MPPVIIPVPRVAANDAALIQGALDGDMSMMRLALTTRANVNGPPSLLYPPIMSAAARDDVGMIEVLLEHGADPNKFADHSLLCPSVDAGIMPGERALHVAAKRGNVAIVCLLKHAGADPNATDTRGRTPLLAACRCLKDCDLVARVLLEVGANPALADEVGYTPLHAVAQHGVMDLVDILYTGAPATLNSYSIDGRTPLFMACVEGHEGMVSRLLSLGAMQWMRSHDPKLCPLMIATEKGFVGVVRVLTNEGMPAVGVMSSLPSAIFGAISCRRAKILQLLLAADGEERRSQWANLGLEGKNMLHYGAADCFPAAVNVLLAAGASEAVRDSEGRFPRDHIGVDLGREQLPMDREKKEVAIRRMLEQGPAYRARLWAWPAEEADGGGYGDRGVVPSSPPAAPKTPVSVRIFRSKKDRKLIVSTTVDR